MSSDTAPEGSAGPRAIVAGHGDFAAGLISAVQQITGRGDQLTGLVVKQLGVADIETLIRATMAAVGVRVVFTDLQAGSCTMAARRALKESNDAVLVAGVNLPMLLDFVLSDATDPAVAAARAAERGRAAVIVHGVAP